MKEEALIDPWKQEEQLALQGHTRRHPETSGLVGGREGEGISRARAFVVIFMGRAGQSGAGSFRLASLSNSGGLRSAGAAPSGLIAGPGAIRAGAGGSVDKGSG